MLSKSFKSIPTFLMRLCRRRKSTLSSHKINIVIMVMNFLHPHRSSCLFALFFVFNLPCSQIYTLVMQWISMHKIVTAFFFLLRINQNEKFLCKWCFCFELIFASGISIWMNASFCSFDAIALCLFSCLWLHQYFLLLMVFSSKWNRNSYYW